MPVRRFQSQISIQNATASDQAVTKSQLDAGVTDAKMRANHTGTQTTSTISDFNTAVDQRIQAIVGAAPAALDTLQELAAALGSDPNFAATINAAQAALASRVTALEAAGTPKRTFSTLVGAGSGSVFNVDHNWNLADKNKCAVQIVDTLTGETVDAGITRSTVNRVIVDFGTHVPASNQYRVLVIEVA
jgi:hypothetical protein